MTEPAAIRATWSTYKPVPTRSVLQLTLEVPLEQQADVFKKLGYPVPGQETWVAVALLNTQKQPEPEKPKQSWESMSYAQRSGILRNDKRFQEWLAVGNAEDAAEHIRKYCRVESCSQIDSNAVAMDRFDRLRVGYLQSTGQAAEQRG